MPLDDLLITDFDKFIGLVETNNIAALIKLNLKSLFAYQDDKGQTALHYAVFKENPQLIELLLFQGAKDNKKISKELLPYKWQQ